MEENYKTIIGWICVIGVVGSIFFGLILYGRSVTPVVDMNAWSIHDGEIELNHIKPVDFLFDGNGDRVFLYARTSKDDKGAKAEFQHEAKRLSKRERSSDTVLLALFEKKEQAKPPRGPFNSTSYSWEQMEEQPLPLAVFTRVLKNENFEWLNLGAE